MSIFAINDPLPSDMALFATLSTEMYDREHLVGSIESLTLTPLWKGQVCY